MSNPILNDNNFIQSDAVLHDEPMTIKGTVNKIFLLFACLIAGAGISFYYLITNPDFVMTLSSISALIGFVIGIITCFNPKIAKYTAAPYALFEGLFIGGISIAFDAAYKGIVIQAVIATFAVMFVMLMLYKARLIRYTEKFQAVLMTGLLSICAVYVIQIVASFFSRSIPLIFDAGPVGIIFSLVVIGFAAMCFINDFFFIEDASNKMLEKDYEWYAAFGLMLTVIWLYLEILRLLAKLNSRR